jgi:PGF-CTERM protein/PGF-pre-PGF domain-containing protein
VDQEFYTGPIDRVSVDFGRSTNGRYAIESVDSLPAGAPAPGGQIVGAVDIQVPDDVASQSATVDITVARNDIPAGMTPADLRVVHYDEDRSELQSLASDVGDADQDSVVLSADTPGFSVFAVVASRTTATTTQTATQTATTVAQTTVEPTTEPTATDTAATPAPAPTDTRTATRSPAATTSGGAPGFGPVVTVIALLLGVVLLYRRSPGT